MGRPKLVWSPIQLRLANQFKIYHVGRLENVLVDLDGVHSSAYFELVELEDETKPYPALLGIDWAFNNNAIINLKKWTMTFESESLKLTTPLDLIEGTRYTKPVKEEECDEEIAELYNITAWREDYINPIVDEELSWRSICSYGTDSEESLERWKNRLHEMSTRRCAHVTKYVRWIGAQLRELPSYDVTRLLSEFVAKTEEVPENQRILALDVALKGTPMRWWATHKEGIDKWSVATHLLQQRFEKCYEQSYTREWRNP